jgi:hypothetical protein
MHGDENDGHWFQVNGETTSIEPAAKSKSRAKSATATAAKTAAANAAATAKAASKRKRNGGGDDALEDDDVVVKDEDDEAAEEALLADASFLKTLHVIDLDETHLFVTGGPADLQARLQKQVDILHEQHTCKRLNCD